MGAAFLPNGRLYAVGGEYALGVNRGTWEFNPTTNSWTILSDTLTARSRAGVAAALGKLYAIGGAGPMGPLDAVEQGTLVPRDTDPPTVTANVAPTPNANGWNNATVLVSFSAVDNSGGSGVKEITYSINGSPPVVTAGASASTTLTAEGTHTISYYATDNATNVSLTKSLTVNLDSTKPTINATAKKADGTDYVPGSWTNQSVTVTFTCTDVLSGVETVSSPVTVSGTGANQSVQGTCTDRAGNIATTTFSNISIDKVAPTGACTLSPSQLWPPNHRMISISATVNTSDQGGSGATAFQLLSVTSNEPDNGLGDGDTADDIQGVSVGTADTSFQVRAERSGTGTGRIYTANYQVTDAAGNMAVCSATISVPHDRGRGGR
jgi:hypothetical protein